MKGNLPIRRALRPPGTLSNAHTGAVSEALATAYLMQRGYDVFRNTAADGPIDLVAVNTHTGECRYFDVKTIRSPMLRSPYKLKAHQVRLGVVPLYVDPASGFVSEHLTEFNQFLSDLLAVAE